MDDPVVAVKGQIAFSSGRGGCLFLLKDGKIERLTLEGGSGVFSADGKKIYFRKMYELFIYNLDTSTIDRLIEINKYKPFEFDVSPDNKKVVFVSRGQKFDYDIPDNIYTANLDGTDYKQLTYFTGGPKGWNAAGAARPRWSPDSKTILFCGPNVINKSNSGDAIYTIKSDGSDLKKVIGRDNDFIFAREPTWSPDSKRIAFVASPKNDKQGYEHIFTSDKDGSNPKKEIVGYNYIFTANADGSDIRQITKKQYDDMTPVFSPDGKQICFASKRHYIEDKIPNAIGSELFVIDIDGTNEVRVTPVAILGDYNIHPILSKYPMDSDPDWHE
jgi:Tol biopolymer transport system component